MKKKKFYEDTEYPTVEQAYDELTRAAFAVWIRLMVATPDQLVSGKRELGKICNYEVNRFYRIMKELHDKDYVRYIKPDKLGRPHTVILHRRAMIGGRNNFVKLAGSETVSDLRHKVCDWYREKHQGEKDAMGCFQLENDAAPTASTGKRERSSSRRISKSSESEKDTDDIPSRRELLAKGRRKYVMRDGEDVPLDEIANDVPLPLEPPPPKKNISDIREDTSLASQDEVKVISSTPSGSPRKLCSKRARKKTANSSGKPKIANEKRKDTKLSQRMAAKRQQIKADRKEKRQKKKRITEWHIDFEKLEMEYGKRNAKGDPSISFNPKSKYRDQLMAILTVPIKGKGISRTVSMERKKAKVVLSRKLGHEFARIYKRYRNLVYEAKELETRFVMPPDGKKHCQRIAKNCIFHQITPRQMLEYWDENIRDFKGGIYPYPPLAFLAGTFAAEQVSAVLFEKTDGGKRKWRSGDFKRARKSAPPPGAHSFFDTEELHKELKIGLQKAGFEVGNSTKYNDRYLLTVQKTAMAIADGKEMFVGGMLKEMVDWAVENLYGEDE